MCFQTRRKLLPLRVYMLQDRQVQQVMVRRKQCLKTIIILKERRKGGGGDEQSKNKRTLQQEEIVGSTGKKWFTKLVTQNTPTVCRRKRTKKNVTWTRTLRSCVSGLFIRRKGKTRLFPSSRVLLWPVEGGARDLGSPSSVFSPTKRQWQRRGE